MLGLESAEGANRFVAWLKRRIEESIRDRRGLEPMIALFIRRHPETGAPLEGSSLAWLAGGEWAALGGQSIPNIGEMFNNPHLKDAVVEVIKAMAGKVDAFAVVIASEAWMVAATADRADFQTAPSDSQHRQEIVWLTLEHPTGDRVWSAPILRFESEVKLGPWADMECGLSAGRFAKILQPTETVH